MAKIRAFHANTLLILLCFVAQSTAAGQQEHVDLRPMTNAQAQDLLQLPPSPLPQWALVLAEPLPNATVALLRLDSLHRSANPIGNVLAAKIRWAVADTLHCDFQSAYATADLMLLGLDRRDVKIFPDDSDARERLDQEVVAFARKLTEAAYSVTDEEVSKLVDQIGLEQVVGIVHTVAFANFQCRLAQGLKCELDVSEPAVPPLDLSTNTGNPNDPPAPQRPAFPASVEDKYLARLSNPTEWNRFQVEDIKQGLTKQQNRAGRVPIPTDEQLDGFTDEELQRSGRVIWSRVSLAYQPELTRAWFRLMNAFRSDSAMDQVFCNSLFLVVTRSNDCFY